jgi:hypothetical protein
MLFLRSEMKMLALLLFVGVAVAYYFGYGPDDLVPSFQTSAPPPKVRHSAPAPAEQTQTAAPVRNNSNVATADDGSMEHRWKP